MEPEDTPEGWIRFSNDDPAGPANVMVQVSQITHIEELGNGKTTIYLAGGKVIDYPGSLIDIQVRITKSG